MVDAMASEAEIKAYDEAEAKQMADGAHLWGVGENCQQESGGIS